MPKQLFKTVEKDVAVKPAAKAAKKAAPKATPKTAKKETVSAKKPAAPAKKATPAASKTAKATPPAGAGQRGPGRPKKVVLNPEPKRPRGRPAIGGPKPTPTERVSQSDKKLVEAGGRILNKLRLSPEVVNKLKLVRGQYDSERAAIEAGIMALTIESEQQSKPASWHSNLGK